MTSESNKSSGINAIIRIIGLVFIIIGLVIIYMAYSNVSVVGSYQSLFVVLGIILFIIGFLSFTVKIE